MIARFLKKYWREDTNKQTQHLLNISRLPCYVFYIDLQILIQVELKDQQTNIQIPCVDTNTNRKSDQKTKSLHLHFVGDALPLRKNLPKSQSSEHISSKKSNHITSILLLHCFQFLDFHLIFIDISKHPATFSIIFFWSQIPPNMIGGSNSITHCNALANLSIRYHDDQHKKIPPTMYLVSRPDGV